MFVKKIIPIFAILSVLTGFTIVNAQITPWEAASQMQKGINLGNTLEPPDEGGWNNPKAQEYYFDLYKEEGFDCIRIPVRWDEHTQSSSPYLINDTWFQRVEEVIDWGLNRDLFIIVNTHHEEWIKSNYSNALYRARFDSIWSQISERFKNKSEKLFFEIINEPYGLTKAQNDELHQRVLSLIRKTNPTRIVIFQGHNWGGSDELIQAAVPVDNYLIGSFHSYDPYTFGLLGEGKWGSPGDFTWLNNKFLSVKDWSDNNNMPVILGEFGSLRSCDYNSRMKHYKAYVELSQKYGFIPCAWDDGGDFRIMERQARLWDEVKDILVHTTQNSPKNPALKIYQDTIIQLTWINPVDDYDSIFVERRTSAGNYVKIASLKGDTTDFFDINPAPNYYYHYRIIAHYNSSDDIYSHPLRILMPVYLPKVREPFYGLPLNIPGLIEAEDFDKGGEGLAYHDTDAANLAGAYRPLEGVDIYDRLGTGYHIGNALPEEWYEYTVNVEKDSMYQIDIYLASLQGGGKFQIKIGNAVTDTLTAPSSFSSLTTKIVTTNLNLLAGEQILRFSVLDDPLFNIDKFNITYHTIVIDVKHNPIEKSLKIYQNLNKELVIYFNADIRIKSIHLFNIYGVLIDSVYQPQNGLQLSPLSIPDGIYIVQALYSDDKRYSEKIIIH